MNQFLAPEIDLDPYSNESSYEVVESFEEGNYRQSVEREVVCAFDGGSFAFSEECKRIVKLRDRAKAKGEEWAPIVVRLLGADIEEKREVIA